MSPNEAGERTAVTPSEKDDRKPTDAESEASPDGSQAEAAGEISSSHSARPAASDASEVPVACWLDEDPDAVPEIARRAGNRPQQENAERLTESIGAGNSAQTTPQENNAQRPREMNTLQAQAEERHGAAPRDRDRDSSPQPGPSGTPPAASDIDPGSHASRQETSPPPSSAAPGASTTEAPPPRFEIPPQVPLPHYEETQEIAPPHLKRRPRSPWAVVLNTLSWLTILAFFAAIALGVLYYRYATDRLFNMRLDTNRTVILTVSPGERLPQIIAKLRKEGVLGSFLGIDDSYLLRYLAWANENSNRIKTGVYRLNTSMSLNEIYEKLIAGSQDFKVTIPEGKTAKETAAIIKRKVDTFDEQRFLALVEDKSFIAGLGLDVPSLEGYLYPDTYYFAPGMKEEDIIRAMVENFIKRAESKLAGIQRTETSDTLTFHEHVIMASLIEREARVDEERPLIASVIFNRLKRGMRLEIDATVNYALGEWGRRLNYQDLKTSSSYNTYLHKGLPPGPICNPQIESLVATFRPAATNYLYYVYKGDGYHAFAATYEEHLSNIRLYRRGNANKPEATVLASASPTPSLPGESAGEHRVASSPLANEDSPTTGELIALAEEDATTATLEKRVHKDTESRPATKSKRSGRGVRRN